MKLEASILQFAQLVAITVVVISCYAVLQPFIPSILFALVVCMSTWPLYLRLRRGLREKATLAALLMVLLLLVLVIVPSALLTISLAGNVSAIVEALNTVLLRGPAELPAWLRHMPIFGRQLVNYWNSVAAGGEQAMAMAEPARHYLLVVANAIGQGLLQMMFAIFMGFFIYRDGDAWVQTLRRGLSKLAGDLGLEIMATIHKTVAGVVQGVFGTALVQATVAVIGFLIAGVPGPLLLGAATFFLSMVPVGPPLLWGGASFWLFYQGDWGWAVFMALWGVLAISSIDNLVRPYFISRRSSLSLLLITLGVFGGVAAFGFIGIFIGPPILAVGLTLIRLWTPHPVTAKNAITESSQLLAAKTTTP